MTRFVHFLDSGEDVLEVHGWVLVVMREIKIDAIATDLENEDWKQKSAHRGKLHTEQLDVEQ